MKKFNFQNRGQGLIGIIVVLAIVALIGGGLYYYRSRQIQKAPQVPQKPVEEVKPKEVTPPEKPEKAEEEKTKIEETANQKTYRNEELGIEFKYPPELKVKEVIGADKKIFLDIEMSPDGFLMIGRQKDYNCDDESTWLAHCDYVCEKEKNKEIRKDIKIGNHSAKFVSRYESSMRPPIVRRTYICVKDVSPPLLFDLTLDKEKESGKYFGIFNQILSTFRFLK